jgi:hypothetical protein
VEVTHPCDDIEHPHSSAGSQNALALSQHQMLPSAIPRPSSAFATQHTRSALRPLIPVAFHVYLTQLYKIMSCEHASRHLNLIVHCTISPALPT